MSSVIGNFIRTSTLDYNTSMDPVSKYRVSTPQSLIDTDFEYGLQAVKWETIQQVANVPTIFSRTGDNPIPITNVTTRSNMDYVYITLASANTTFSSGAPFIIQGFINGFLSCEGIFLVTRIIQPNIIVYRSKQIQPVTTSIFDPYATTLYQGYFYASTMFTLDYLTSITTNSNTASTITANTLYPHSFNINTQYELVNSVGRKQYTIDSSLSSSSISNVWVPGNPGYSNTFILYNNFDLSDNAVVVYSNVSGTPLSNLPVGGTYITGSNFLASGSSYYVYNAFTNYFQLSTVPLSCNLTPNPTNYLLSFTSNGSFPSSNLFWSIDFATDSASITQCNALPTNIVGSTPSYQIQLPYTNQIVPNFIQFIPNQTLNLQSNCFTFSTPHRQASGAPIAYSNLGNQSVLYSNTNGVALSNYNYITGSPSTSLYYAIRLDGYNLQLSTTPQYGPPYSNITFDYPASNGPFIGQNGAFNGSNQLTFLSIAGESYCSGTVTYLNSNIVNGVPVVNNTYTFTSSTLINTLYRNGDIIRIEVPPSCNVYNGVTLTGGAFSATAATLLNGTPVLPTNATGTILTAYITSNIINPGYFSNQSYYYLRASGNANNYNIYPRYIDAVAGTSTNALTNIGAGTVNLYTYTPGGTFEAPIAYIGGSNKFNSTIPFLNIAPYNAPMYPTFTKSYGSNLNFFIRTGLFPRCDGFNIHRAYDGGIEIIPPRSADGQIIRQTRRYFRYQPGKGIQISFSANFSAPVEIDRMFTSNANSSQVICVTKTIHRLSSNLPIIVDFMNSSYDCAQQPALTYPQNPISPWSAPYATNTQSNIIGGTLVNSYGTYIINNVINANTFSYIASGTPAQYPGSCNLGAANPFNANASNYVYAPQLPIVYVNNWSNAKLRTGLFDDQNGMFFEYDGSNIYAVRRESVTQATGQVYVINGSCLIQGQINYSQNTYNTAFTTQLNSGCNIVLRGQTYRVSYILNDSNMYIQPPYRGVTSSNVVISIVNDFKTSQPNWNIDPCNGTGPTGYALDIHKIQMVYLDYSWYGAGKIRYGFKDSAGRVRYIHEFQHNNNSIRAFMRSGNLPARYEAVNIGVPTWVPSLMHWGVSAIMDGGFDDDKAYLFTAPANIIQFTAGDSITFVGSAGSNYGVAPFNNSIPSLNFWLYTLQGGGYSTSSSSPATNLNVQNTTSNNIFFGTTAVGQNIPDINSISSFYDAYTQTQASGYSLYTTAQTASNAPYTFQLNNTITVGGTISNPYLCNLPALIQNNVTYKDVQNIRSGTLITGCNIQPNTYTIGTPQRGNPFGYLSGSGTVLYTGQIFLTKPVYSPFLASQITIGQANTDLIPNIIPLVSVRLCPSVDSSISSLLGVRELINRMQLRLRSVDILTTNDTECRIYLNSTIDNPAWVAATTPSLTQLIKHNKNDVISAGVLIYSFRVSGGATDNTGKRSTTVSTQDLQLLGSVQNSIIGGNNVYPDGPDIITIAAVCLDSAGVSSTAPYIVSSRLSWTEAQA